MRIFVPILVFSCISIGFTSGQDDTESNFTFTYQMAAYCKEHLCRKGYSYDTFYSVDSEDRKLTNNSEVVFEMHFAVLAASNGHVLLSTVPHPESTDSVYEIVIGGGANKFTELRRNLRRNAKASVKSFGILSAIEFKAFYILILDDGTIEFGREGAKKPIISFYDVDPVSVKYFSFASWSGVEAKFMYDCPAPGANGTMGVEPDSKVAEPDLTPSQKLRNALLQKRSTHIAPGETIPIKVEVEVTRVRYDAFDAQMTTSLSVYTSWVNADLAWDPSEYNDTTKITFRQGQIWRPTFFVFNSDDMGSLNTRNPELIWMFHSGEAIFHFDAEAKSWCADYSSGLTRWPRDEYNCYVVIGPWEAHERITIDEVAASSTTQNDTFSDIDDVIETEWDMVVNQGVVPHPAWNYLFNITQNDTYQSDRYLIKIKLKRRAPTYDIAFYTPLVVLITFLLMSYWTTPVQLSRVWFYSGMAIVICMGLCYIDYLIPCHSTPFILVIYLTLLAVVLLSLLIQVLMMTSVAQEMCKAEAVQTMITSKMFRIIFLLPPLKTCSNYESINEAYNTQDDDSGVVLPPRTNTIEVMETEEIRRSEVEDVGEVLDKIMFLTFTVVFAIILCI